MPICQWCGVESKNDKVCDWCKRPLALRPMRMADAGKNDLEFLKQEEPSGGLFTAGRVAVILTALAAAFAVFLILPHRTQVAPPARMIQEPRLDQNYLAELAPVNPGPVDIGAPPVFLPPPTPVGYTPRSQGNTRPMGQGAPRPRIASVVTAATDSPEQTASIQKVKLNLVTAKDNKTRCIGMIVLKNADNRAIVDYRLEFETRSKSYAVEPFEGTLSKPQVIYAKTIKGRSVLKTPILVQDFSPSSKNGHVKGTVVLRAWYQGEATPTIDQYEIE